MTCRITLMSSKWYSRVKTEFISFCCRMDGGGYKLHLLNLRLRRYISNFRIEPISTTNKFSRPSTSWECSTLQTCWQQSSSNNNIRLLGHFETVSEFCWVITSKVECGVLGWTHFRGSKCAIQWFPNKCKENGKSRSISQAIRMKESNEKQTEPTYFCISESWQAQIQA